MAAGDFNELELLSQEDLIAEIVREVLKTHPELRRRKKVKRDFLKSLCNRSVETRVWWILYEAGGAQRFTDIFPVAGCSRTKLNDTLQKLVEDRLVRKVEALYQAVLPPELVHFLD